MFLSKEYNKWLIHAMIFVKPKPIEGGALHFREFIHHFLTFFSRKGNFFLESSVQTGSFYEKHVNINNVKRDLKRDGNDDRSCTALSDSSQANSIKLQGKRKTINKK